jgi:hypothetical protein
MARRIARVAALCALAAGISATSAFAHAGNPNFESLVNGVSPAIPGFTVEVLNGDDRLGVMNTGPRTVTIDGYSKDPFVRMSPDGTVAVNLRSPAYYLDQERDYGTVKVPPTATAAAARAHPQWQVVAHTGRYEFHDHRIHWMAASTPQQVTDKSKRTKVADWQVPVHAQGASGSIDGTLFWRGTGAGAPLGAFIAFGIFLALSGAAVIVVRRRRAAGDGGAAGAGAPNAAGDAPAAKPRQEAW